MTTRFRNWAVITSSLGALLVGCGASTGRGDELFCYEGRPCPGKPGPGEPRPAPNPAPPPITLPPPPLATCNCAKEPGLQCRCPRPEYRGIKPPLARKNRTSRVIGIGISAAGLGKARTAAHADAKRKLAGRIGSYVQDIVYGGQDLEKDSDSDEVRSIFKVLAEGLVVGLAEQEAYVTDIRSWSGSVWNQHKVEVQAQMYVPEELRKNQFSLFLEKVKQLRKAGKHSLATRMEQAAKMVDDSLSRIDKLKR